MAKKIKIRKVPIEALLEIITHLFDRGVDFVDFDGELGEDEDKLGISFGKNYMAEELADTYDTMFEEAEDDPDLEQPIEVTRKLSDDDLNQII